MNPQAVFFINRTRLSLYTAEKSEVVDLPLSEEIARDLEIVSQPSLERVLNNWLEQLKITPQQAIVVLDDSIYFSKKIAQANGVSAEVREQFLSIVPFNKVRTKTFPIQEGAFILAVNKNFIEPLTSALEKVGFIVVSISPAIIFGINFSQKPFDKEVAELMLSKLDLIQQYSLLTKEEVEAKIVEPEPFFSVKLNKKVILLLVVFIVLGVILLTLLHLQGIIQLF